jgi:hypothetical protein
LLYRLLTPTEKMNEALHHHVGSLSSSDHSRDIQTASFDPFQGIAPTTLQLAGGEARYANATYICRFKAGKLGGRRRTLGLDRRLERPRRLLNSSRIP